MVEKTILALRKYSALSLETGKDSDHSFIGQTDKEIKRKIKDCPLYKEIEILKHKITKYNRTNHGNTDDIKHKSFQFKTECRRLTNQLPITTYDKLIVGTDKKAKDMRYFDRLLNGIPIIDETKFDRPILIVDSPESIMSTLFNQRYVKLRKYSLN